MPNLKREDAIARAELLTVNSYDVALDLTQGPQTFGSTVEIHFDCLEPGTSSFVEVVPRSLRQVVLNGEEIETSTWRDGRIPLPNLAASNVLTVVAEMAYSQDGEGLHRFTDPEDSLAYTYMMGFLDMASRVFACFEQPDLKAPLRLSVDTDPQWTVVSNEDGEQTRAGHWEFQQTQPLATYFMTFIAGPYHSVYREHDGVRFGLHARQTCATALDTDTEELFEVTFGIWDRLHELYGVRYPFGNTYDQCFVPEFNAGAMENAGCVTFRDDYMFRSEVTETAREERAITIAHEMAHMWFGDLVTTRWWDDLWLNESFADCMGVRATAEGTRFTAAAAGEAYLAASGIAADQRPSTHPVAGDVRESGEALNNFDGISYAKGGAILTQLNAWLGDEAYFAGLRSYFARHRFGNATLWDLMDCLSESSGHDLRQWAQAWLRTTGPNTLRAEISAVDGRYQEVALLQTAPESQPTLRPHHVRIGSYRVRDGVARRIAQIAVEVTGERTAIPELAGAEQPDLLLLNDEDLTYAKVRLDPHSLERLPAVITKLADPIARSQLWNMVNDMVRDGDMTMSRFMKLLHDCLPSIPDVAQLDPEWRFAVNAVNLYLPPDDQPRARQELFELARKIRRQAPAGSGIALSALRQEIAGVDAPADRSWLRDMLNAEAVPAGIELDSDLRWTILRRLAVIGEASENDIAAELERDGSSDAHQHAATCRVSFPTAEAKAAGWDTLMSGGALSNRMLLATAQGFWWPEQTAVTEPYVSRFFEEAPAGIARKSPWEARKLTLLLFPRYAVSQDTIVRAERLLSDAELVPDMRRQVIDALDDMRRALRARGA